MKTLKFFALVGMFLFFIFCQPTTAACFDQDTLDEMPNYVVIGAFAKQTNAIRFTNHAHNDLELDAKYEMNLRRNLYYVYVLSTDDLSIAMQEAKRLREESEFRDTWVYRGSFKNDASAAADIVAYQEIRSEGTYTSPAPAERTDVISDSTSDVEGGPVDNEESTAESEGFTIPAAALGEEEDDGTEGTKFLFKISRQSDLRRIRGDVDVIDVDRSRKMGTYKGNLTVKIPSPANQSGKMSVVCEVFGYRKVQRDLNYNDPEAGDGIIRDATGAVVVPFELVRLKKGDIAIMYHVYFFKDAAVMRPESNYEVNSLVEMLRENPKYKIKIHGHTNGNAAGKIIMMSEDSQNFFSLRDTKEGMGSAKKLSEDRAIVMRNYLENNGIDPKRMEIKAWGGKKPIYDKLSNRAQENVRVEIEILED